jgi:NADH-quinone oxidoreductase subunit J
MDALFAPRVVGCGVALASALGLVLARRPIYAAIFLLVNSLSLAGLFALLAAPMVAVGQVIIYSGAIVVLFLFVVTLLPSGGRELNPTGRRMAAAFVAAGGLLAALAAVLGASPLPPVVPQPDLGVAAVGRALFGPLLVAFELTAPLLLVAIVGGVVIWRRQEPRPPTLTRPARPATPRRLVMHR